MYIYIYVCSDGHNNIIIIIVKQTDTQPSDHFTYDYYIIINARIYI